MKNRKEILLTATGILLGTLLGGPTVHAAVEQLNVYPSTQKFYLDGQAIQLEAYGINGYNYVKLGDLCPALGVDLAYDGATNSVYIGNTPEIQEGGVINVPQSDERFILKEGDKVLCDDGSVYEITDMSRWTCRQAAGSHLRLEPLPRSRAAKSGSAALLHQHWRHPVYPESA